MPVLLIAASAAAAIIHFALGPDHVDELGPLGLGFYLAGVLQLGWAIAAAIAWRDGARPRTDGRRVAAFGLGLNVAILGAWLVARTFGLPAGDEPWTPEPVGLSDAIAAVLEIAIVGGLVARMRRPTSVREPVPAGGVAARELVRDRASLIGAVPVLALILVATVAAVSAGQGHAEGTSHDGDPHAIEMPGDHTH